MSIHPFNAGPHGEAHANTWQRRLGSARSAREVIAIARDFMATFSPQELHSVPEHCRPSHRLSADELSALAFDLARHERTDMHAEEAVSRLARFFSEASLRVSQLAARGEGGGDLEERQSA